MKTLNISKLSREDWLKARAPFIGGSDAGAILGLNPFRSPVDVWKEKLGFAEPFAGNEATYWGNALEEAVARRYEEETGNTVERWPYMVQDGIFAGNLDRLVSLDGKPAAKDAVILTDRALECKTTGAFSWDDGVVPLSYQAQVQHYMGLCPVLVRFDVSCLFLPNRHYEVHPISRNDAVIRTMRERLTEWWQKHIIAGDAPEPRTEEECRALFPESKGGETCLASEAVMSAIAELRAAKAEMDALEARMDRAKTTIMSEMGAAETLVDALGGKLATWKSGAARSKTDWKAVAEHLHADPEIVGMFTTTAPAARIFRLKQGA